MYFAQKWIFHIWKVRFYSYGAIKWDDSISWPEYLQVILYIQLKVNWWFQLRLRVLTTFTVDYQNNSRFNNSLWFFFTNRSIFQNHPKYRMYTKKLGRTDSDAKFKIDRPKTYNPQGPFIGQNSLISGGNVAFWPFARLKSVKISAIFNKTSLNMKMIIEMSFCKCLFIFKPNYLIKTSSSVFDLYKPGPRKLIHVVNIAPSVRWIPADHQWPSHGWVKESSADLKWPRSKFWSKVDVYHELMRFQEPERSNGWTLWTLWTRPLNPH